MKRTKYRSVYKRKLRNGEVRFDAVASLGNKQRWKRGFLSADDAAAWLIQARTSFAEGRSAPTPSVTLAQWVGDYINRKAWRKRVTQLYAGYLRRYIEPSELASLRLNEVSWTHLTEFYRRLSEGLSPKTVRNIHGLLSGALKDAVKKQVIPLNPASMADLPKPIEPDLAVWSGDELRQFLKATQDHPWYPAWRLAAFPGLRRGEVLGLKWEDVDFLNNRLTVRRSLGHNRFLEEPKTVSSYRTVPLDDETCLALREHQLGINSEWVFPGRNPELPVTPSAFNQALEKAVRAAGLTPISPHGLRRTWATLAMEEGVPDRVIQTVMGHSRSSTTRLYQTARPVLMEDAVRLVANAVAKREERV